MDLSALTANGTIAFDQIDYPGWQRYVTTGFSANALIVELAAEIDSRVPTGPIRLVGLSMGGHFGYAAALQLQAMGREVSGFCAIDSFMIDTAEPTEGWLGRALGEGLELLRGGRIAPFLQFARSRFWRALLRLSGERLNEFCLSGWLPGLAKIDPILRKELRMRLLVREVAPWLAALDDEPVVLRVPAILLRTSLTACDDAAWRRRCPDIQILELPGQHHTLFEAENGAALRDAFITGTSEWCLSPVYSTSKP